MNHSQHDLGSWSGGEEGEGLNHVPPLGSPALFRLSYEDGSSNKQTNKPRGVNGARVFHALLLPIYNF